MRVMGTPEEEARLQEILRRYDCPEFLPHDRQLGICPRCGTTLTGRQRRWCSTKCQNEWREQHDWNAARSAAKRRDGHRCVRPGCTATSTTPGTRLEVNHIAPRNGDGYGWGCWNHLANLETLCHEHHLVVTREQARARSRATSAQYRADKQRRIDDEMGQAPLDFSEAIG